MKFALVVIVAGVAGSFAALPLGAQDAGGVQTPAERPPAWFRGNQFVDSSGCVFVRAQVDGSVTWVPRVNRDRQLICRQAPTVFASATPGETASPAAQSNEDLAEKGLEIPTTGATATQAVRNAAAPGPISPTPTVATRADAVEPPKGKVGATAVRLPTEPSPARAPAPTGVANTSAPTAAGSVGSGAATHPPALSLQTRVLPQHIHERRLRDRKVTVPPGYRPAWDDGRLNPRRAEQSLEGMAQTRLKWTNTVPRRLVDQSTGRDVTTTVPLLYPYTDLATQRRRLGTVTIIHRDGQIIKRVVRNTSRADRAATAPVAPAPVVPSKSNGRPRQHYVQVGMFGVPANANATAQRLARTGLPTRTARLERGSKTYKLVLAGPFATSARAQNALKQARAAGFRDAYVRKLR